MITEALRDEILWIINMAWDSLVEFSTRGWVTRLGLKDSAECWVCIEHWTSRGHNRFSRDDREQTSILPVTCIVDACTWTPQDDLYLVAPSSLFAWMNFGTFHVDFNSMGHAGSLSDIYICMYVCTFRVADNSMPIEKNQLRDWNLRKTHGKTLSSEASACSYIQLQNNFKRSSTKKTWRQNIACIVLSRCVVNTQKNKEIITWLNGYILSIVWGAMTKFAG